MGLHWCPPCEGELSGATSMYKITSIHPHMIHFVSPSYVFDHTAQANALLSFPDTTVQTTLSSMPCSFCNTWDNNPSWHRCEAACVNAQGTAKLHSGDEVRCSRSWDGTWWFFFCNQCKKNRPHIMGVLRKARIWHSPYLEQSDYTTDSENASYSYSSSDSDVEFFSILETARARPLSTIALPQPSQLKK